LVNQIFCNCERGLRALRHAFDNAAFRGHALLRLRRMTLGGTMIELYTWMTPNGQKVSIMLEEVGLPYRVHPIDITKGEQFDPAFLKIAPNNKIPAIVDTDTGLQLMESGVILLCKSSSAYSAIS